MGGSNGNGNRQWCAVPASARTDSASIVSLGTRALSSTSASYSHSHSQSPSDSHPTRSLAREKPSPSTTPMFPPGLGFLEAVRPADVDSIRPIGTPALDPNDGLGCPLPPLPNLRPRGARGRKRNRPFSDQPAADANGHGSSNNDANEAIDLTAPLPTRPSWLQSPLVPLPQTYLVTLAGMGVCHRLGGSKHPLLATINSETGAAPSALATLVGVSPPN
jgi:hypothetical protein